MKIYEDDLAPSCRRVRIFMAEKGIDVSGSKVGILQGENLEQEFLSINPYGILPVLELDDGTRICESVAICRYIEALHPNPPLMGTTALEQAFVDMYDRRSDFDGILAVAEFFRNAIEPLAGRVVPGVRGTEQIPALIERGRQRTLIFFQHLERRLADRDYLATDRFTNADITAMCAVDWAEFAGLDIPADCPSVQRWYGQINTRPSAQAWPGMKALAARG